MQKHKEYRISVESEDWVTPEETLLDSQSSYSDVEQPISGVVFKLAFVTVTAVFVVILGYVFKMTVIDFGHFSQLALRNRSVDFFIPPPRGIIYDRNGEPLTKNVPVFNLIALSREIKNDSNQADINIKKLAGILGINEVDFQNNINANISANSVFIAASDISKDKVLAIETLDPGGFYTVANTKRYYPWGTYFSHLIGYIGKVGKDDLADDYYRPTDTIGRLGAEVFYEKVLRGEHGHILFDNKNARNQLNELETMPGRDLVLNIDGKLQQTAVREMDSVLRGAGLSRGAIVIQNPRNGEVLAMASFPLFDNNTFSSPISDKEFNSLFLNKRKPLFNRAISGLYNPGSTIKPLIGLMALEEKIIKPQDTIQDCVSISFPNPNNPEDPYVFKNWRTEYGLFNLRRAIANSCNIFFFMAGGGWGDKKGLGIERIAKYLKLSSADKKLGVDLYGEGRGFVPAADWKLREKNEQWYTGDTYNVSIGQGDLLVTPLWLSAYVSAIANGGTIYKPRIAGKILDDKKHPVKLFEEEVLGELPFKKEYIDEMRRDMLETVISGTARSLQDLPVKVAAKTGTAEVLKGRSVNSLFISFAPYENSQISVTVLIEGSASNEGLATKITHNIYHWYFNQNTAIPTPNPALSPHT